MRRERDTIGGNAVSGGTGGQDSTGSGEVDPPAKKASRKTITKSGGTKQKKRKAKDSGGDEINVKKSKHEDDGDVKDKEEEVHESIEGV